MGTPQSDPSLSILTPPTVPESPLPPAGSTLKMEPAATPDKAMDITSKAVLIGAPILLLMPPRKLDLYTFSLCGLWVFSANHQVRTRSGQGLLEWAAARRAANRSSTPTSSAATTSTLTERASQAPLVDELWREELRGWRRDPWAEAGAIVGFDGRVRARQLEVLEGVRSAGSSRKNEAGETGRSALMLPNGQRAFSRAAETAETDGAAADREGGVKGMMQDLWYGNENPADWREKRMAEERELAAQGASVGDRILSQIYAVWTQAHTEGDKADEERKKEEQAREEKSKGQERKSA